MVLGIYRPYGINSTDLYSYYKRTLNHINRAGYYTTTTKYYWESNLYDLNNPQLLYTIQTRSFDLASIQSLAHEYGRLILNDMLKRKILTRPSKSLNKSIAAF